MGCYHLEAGKDLGKDCRIGSIRSKISNQLKLKHVGNYCNGLVIRENCFNYRCS